MFISIEYQSCLADNYRGLEMDEQMFALRDPTLIVHLHSKFCYGSILFLVCIVWHISSFYLVLKYEISCFDLDSFELGQILDFAFNFNSNQIDFDFAS